MDKFNPIEFEGIGNKWGEIAAIKLELING